MSKLKNYFQTNFSIRKCKLDADTSTSESEKDAMKSRPSKQSVGKGVGSHLEEFPRGQKAQAICNSHFQGRVLEQFRKRQKLECSNNLTDDVGCC